MPRGRYVLAVLNITGQQNPDNTLGQTPQYPNNLTWAYSMSTCVPPTNNTVVQLDGDIDLSQLPGGNGLGAEVDLIFGVTGSVLGTDGQYYHPRWALAGEGGPPIQPYCWLVASDANPVVIPWPAGMAAISNDPWITIQDNLRGNPYYYALGVSFDNLPGHRNTAYFLSFDPKIVNPN